MAEPVIIPEYVTITDPDPSLAAQAGTAACLLAEASDHGLPGPRYLSIYGTSRDISIGFGTDPGVFHVLHQWAERYGGVLKGERYTRDDGTAYVRCDVTFIYERTGIELYGYAPAAT